jgi:hypothetical protein
MTFSAYDPETITVLRAVLDEAWEHLATNQKTRVSKAIIAQRILDCAARGERDRARLRAAALRLVHSDA